MKLESEGIIISMRPIGERDSLARIFTRDHGVMVGIMRGAVVAKKNKPLCAQRGTATWNARTDSQLGVFHWDMARNMSARFITNANALGLMNAAFELINTLIPERAPYPLLYDDTITMLENLSENGAESYLKWEIAFIRELGYALDTSKCAVCGRTDNLSHISPRTGHAVCANCAAPYVDRIYKLPITMDITRFFLEKICADMGCALPQFRTIL